MRTIYKEETIADLEDAIRTMDDLIYDIRSLDIEAIADWVNNQQSLEEVIAVLQDCYAIVEELEEDD